MGGIAPFLWVDERNVTLAFLYLGCSGIFWLVGGTTNLQYPDKNKTALEDGVHVYILLLVSLCQVGRRRPVSGVCQDCQCSQPCPVLETGILLEPVVLISFLACDDEQYIALELCGCCVSISALVLIIWKDFGIRVAISVSFPFSVFNLPCLDSSVAAA